MALAVALLGRGGAKRFIATQVPSFEVHCLIFFQWTSAGLVFFTRAFSISAPAGSRQDTEVHESQARATKNQEEAHQWWWW
jgi:hypothetical protein